MEETGRQRLRGVALAVQNQNPSEEGPRVALEPPHAAPARLMPRSIQARPPVQKILGDQRLGRLVSCTQGQRQSDSNVLDRSAAPATAHLWHVHVCIQCDGSDGVREESLAQEGPVDTISSSWSAHDVSRVNSLKSSWADQQGACNRCVAWRPVWLLRASPLLLHMFPRIWQHRCGPCQRRWRGELRLGAFADFVGKRCLKRTVPPC